MANRFPLIVDSSALQIKELPASDNLDLANSSIVNVVDITASGNVSVGGTLTYEDVKNVDSIGVVTARNGIKVGAGQSISAVSGVITYFGHAGGLTNIPAGQITGALPAIDGSALTGLPQSGVGIRSDSVTIGFGVTFLDFTGSGIGTVTTDSVSGIGTIVITDNTGGGGGGAISTEALVTSGIVTTLNLTDAQDHKVTATGICTITCTGGAEGESHTLRIINSGISTVGFSTYFLFPSGSPPSLPTGSGAISLISFTVNRVGTAGTQLLSGASVNFS